MKKLFSVLVLSVFLSHNAVFAFDYAQAPNGMNRNFYPLMQHKFEKEETLDFVNHPEDYKRKRAEKDAKLDYLEGKTTNPYYKPFGKYNKNSIPVNMEFTTTGNGNIKIQEIK